MNPIEYIHDLQWSDIPEPVRPQSTRCLLGTMGVFCSGSGYAAMAGVSTTLMAARDFTGASVIGALNIQKEHQLLGDDIEKVCLGMSELASAKIIQNLLYQTDIA